MTKSNRLLFTAITGLILGSPLSAQEISDGSDDQERSSQSGSIVSNSPAVVAAINRLSDEIAKSREEQTDPYGEAREQRERRDIAAQENMVGWTKAMFWAVIAQTVLALGALVALVCDLRQSRKSAEGQLRAYVGFAGWRWHVSNGEGQLEIDLKNFGQTPARNLCYNFLLTADETMNFDALDWEAENGADIEPNGEWNELSSNRLKIDKSIPLYCVGEFRFTDVFERRWAMRFIWKLAAGEDDWSAKQGNKEHRIT